MHPRTVSKRLRGSTRGEEEEEEEEEEDTVRPPKKKGRKTVTVPPRKPTLFDDLDASSSHQRPRNARDVLNELHGDDGDDDESSLSSLSDADLADPPIPRPGTVATQNTDDDDDDDDDENLEFEDVHHIPEHQSNAPLANLQDLNLTLVRDNRISLTNSLGNKKGPTKKERAVRTACHRLHVMCLLWHNAVRNSWLCDQEVQAILLSHLTPGLWEEVDRWRRNCGLEVPTEPAKGKNGKGKAKRAADRKSRDWGAAAKRLEEGEVNMAHGDPIFRLMRALTMFWKQRFRITAPGIRKLGYMSLERLDRITKAHAKKPDDPDLFGERIESLQDFRKRAQECSGSRDIGAQLFTALLRALGLEARMVASLQPLGFGWTKAEEAEPEEIDAVNQALKKPESKTSKNPTATRLQRPKRATKPVVDVHSDDYTDDNEDSDESLIEIPSAYKQKKKATTSKTFDKSLEFPHYWTEVLSLVTNKYLPVDPLVKFIVATNRELIESFEPRGAKADRAKQVIAYVVGYSSDGSAKDVTLRYLKRQVMPGRTKGMRVLAEKIPVYNRHGKVKRYEQFDWFKYVMQGYERGGSNPKYPITETDMLEDSTDLKSRQPEKKEPKEGLETLQYYKTSKEFVLERHLKREEALLATAEPVKVFSTKGKGGAKNEENVYLRKDVVPVKSAETWHKQGRAPKASEEPLKRVPYRAATINRKLAIEEAEKATGQKVLQGLYSFEQTDWIIPPPIKDGKIPKNEYGNIDLFVEHMLPEGAVHVPYRRAMPVCKRLGIDFAEAVVDFDFGHRMAVPVIQGVVIAEEHHDKVMQELVKDEAERTRKEDAKRSKAALDMWRKLYMGMRIAERLRLEYGDVGEVDQVFRHHHEVAGPGLEVSPDDEEEDAGEQDMAGGFLPEGFDVSEEEPDRDAELQRSSYFSAHDGGEDGDSDSDIGLVIENGRPNLTATNSTTTDSGDSEGQSSEGVRPSPAPLARAPPSRRQRGGSHAGAVRGRGRSSPQAVEGSDESGSGEEDADWDDSDEYVE